MIDLLIDWLIDWLSVVFILSEHFHSYQDVTECHRKDLWVTHVFGDHCLWVHKSRTIWIMKIKPVAGRRLSTHKAKALRYLYLKVCHFQQRKQKLSLSSKIVRLRYIVYKCMNKTWCMYINWSNSTALQAVTLFCN